MHTWIRTKTKQIKGHTFCLCFLFYSEDMEEVNPSSSDNIVTDYATYEDFLDSQITPLDLYFLEVARFYISLLSECSFSKILLVILHPRFFVMLLLDKVL